MVAPKKSDIKICDVMNESVCNSLNRTKNNTTDDILYTINNNFVNIAKNTIKNFLMKSNLLVNLTSMKSILILQILILSLLQYKEHRSVISNTESYLEKVIQDFKTLIANVKDFQNKNR